MAAEIHSCVRKQRNKIKVCCFRHCSVCLWYNVPVWNLPMITYSQVHDLHCRIMFVATYIPPFGGICCLCVQDGAPVPRRQVSGSFKTLLFCKPHSITFQKSITLIIHLVEWRWRCIMFKKEMQILSS